MDYRRTRQQGGAYLFTVNLAERSGTPLFLVDRIDDLRTAVRVVKQRHPFDIVAWVVPPEHMHVVWTLSEDDGDCATRWMLIKAGFSRSVPKGERIPATQRGKGERGIWQRRFWEPLITDEDDLRRHADWLYSSIHRCIQRGEVPEDWAVVPDGDFRAGEG